MGNFPRETGRSSSTFSKSIPLKNVSVFRLSFHDFSRKSIGNFLGKAGKIQRPYPAISVDKISEFSGNITKITCGSLCEEFPPEWELYLGIVRNTLLQLTFMTLRFHRVREVEFSPLFIGHIL